MITYTQDLSSTLTPLTAISPIDGRYRSRVAKLANSFSEAAWIRAEVGVEIEYLISLSEKGILRPLSGQETGCMRSLYRDFGFNDAQEVKNIENTRAKKHNIKAIEYWVGDKFANNSLADLTSMIHFGLTSEDVENIAITSLLQNSVRTDYLPPLMEIAQGLYDFSRDYRDFRMLARTHGKAAAPTTAGKEVSVYMDRLQDALKNIGRDDWVLPGKLNGPVGTYDPLTTAYPQYDWMKFSAEFVAKFGLKPHHATTQIAPHDKISRLFRDMVGVNDILEDMSQNFWRYVSDDWFKLVAGSRGISSVMAHKRNPEEFENAEGNLQTSSTLLSFLASKLTKSRLQRDLSGSTVRRNYGVAIAHGLVAYSNINEGLGAMSVEKDNMLEALYAHPEILSTNMQTILRSVKQQGAYEKLQELTRGKKVCMAELVSFVDELPVGDDVKARLKSLDLAGAARAPDVVVWALPRTRRTLNYLRKKLEMGKK